MVTVGFHYMKKRLWDELNRSKGEDRFVRPCARLVRLGCIAEPDIPELPSWAHDSYVFAFPDREAPGPWKKYDHWEDEWEALTHDISFGIMGTDRIACLRFNLLPTDEAYVVDRAPYADFLRGRGRNKQDAIKAYALSRVLASKYAGTYRMPELILRNPIELGRLTLHSVFEREVVKRNGEWTVVYNSIFAG